MNLKLTDYTLEYFSYILIQSFLVLKFGFGYHFKIFRCMVFETRMELNVSALF